MFVDIATVKVKAGNGGNGVVSFRREKFVEMGGPDGGDGGKGGDIVFEASNSQNTLANYRYQKLLTSENGHSGSKRKKHGRNGKDRLLKVPVGTMIVDGEDNLVADLREEGQRAVVGMGGLGGFGNAHFLSSTRQAPRVAEKGEAGDEDTLTLELKMIADVGLVGLPNAGKSTLLSVVSNARPEIADYPFTTIRPNLGVVDLGEDNSLLVADIPGLIEGASEGKGLGDDFLRHVERTAVLLHLIDSYSSDIVDTYKTIQKELKEYKVDLSKKPQIIALTKIEGLDDDIVDDQIKMLKKAVPKGIKIVGLSSIAKKGLKDLLSLLQETVKAERKKQAEKAAEKAEDELPVITISDENSWKVEKTKKGYMVSGKKIERFASRTDFESYHGVQRLRDILRKLGIMHELARKGIEAGERIEIGKHGSLEY
jgi:GTP-binding protein